MSSRSCGNKVLVFWPNRATSPASGITRPDVLDTLLELGQIVGYPPGRFDPVDLAAMVVGVARPHATVSVKREQAMTLGATHTAATDPVTGEARVEKRLSVELSRLSPIMK